MSQSRDPRAGRSIPQSIAGLPQGTGEVCKAGCEIAQPSNCQGCSVRPAVGYMCARQVAFLLVSNGTEKCHLWGTTSEEPCRHLSWTHVMAFWTWRHCQGQVRLRGLGKGRTCFCCVEGVRNQKPPRRLLWTEDGYELRDSPPPGGRSHSSLSWNLGWTGDVFSATVWQTRCLPVLGLPVNRTGSFHLGFLEPRTSRRKSNSPAEKTPRGRSETSWRGGAVEAQPHPSRCRAGGSSCARLPDHTCRQPTPPRDPS